MYTFSSWVTTPENTLARAAVQCVADCVCSGQRQREINPLFLHGPTGTGKTHLVYALAEEITRQRPNLIVTLCPAAEAKTVLCPTVPPSPRDECDLLVVEDLNYLKPRWVDLLARVFDARLSRHQQMVFTAPVGPGNLAGWPLRLRNRLGCGLVAGLEPLAPPSRLTWLRERARQRSLTLEPEILNWLAEHVRGNPRQLEGALNRMERLARVHGRIPDLATVCTYFQADVQAARPTVELIAERESRFFQVKIGQVRSRKRRLETLLPRQVSMYLARKLTPLSLEEIGAYFGGRDHSTVLHACRKVEQAMTHDFNLSGKVRELHADLG
jgi:chromosomal replication initiator protein